MGGYTIVERKKINEILNEQKLTMSGMVDDKHLINIGKVASIYTNSGILYGRSESKWKFNTYRVSKSK